MNPLVNIVIALLIGIACSLIAQHINRQKNLPLREAWLAGMLLGPLGLLIIILASRRTEATLHPIEHLRLLKPFAILLAAAWLMTCIPNPVMTALSNFFVQDLPPVSRNFSGIITVLMIMFSAVNLVSGACLWSMAKKEGRTPCIWLLLGFVYGILALGLYWLRRPERYPHPRLSVSGMLGMLIIIGLLSKLVSYSSPYFLIRYFGASLEYDRFRLAVSIGTTVRTVIMVLVNIGLAEWVYGFAKRHHDSPAGIWWLFTGAFGIIAPIIYFCDVVRSTYVASPNDTFAADFEGRRGKLVAKPNVPCPPPLEAPETSR